MSLFAASWCSEVFDKLSFATSDINVDAVFAVQSHAVALCLVTFARGVRAFLARCATPPLHRRVCPLLLPLALLPAVPAPCSRCAPAHARASSVTQDLR